MEIAIVVLLGLLVLGVFWLILSAGRNQGREAFLQSQLDTLRAEMNSALSSNLKLVTTQLSNVTSQVNDQLSTVSLQLQSSTGQINERMDNAARVVGEVRHKLGELSKATEQIYEVGKDISGLEEILRAPKIRGGLGEFFLGDLLSQCLPSTHYELQYGFKGGTRVDAVIRLKGGLVPIDSKFPLENFRKIFESLSEADRKAAKRKFITDCKKHIDAIASSYILPEEGTLNFALMYIPAENVYYETIIKDEEFGDEKTLMSYAFSRRVIAVSPNSFYAYLQTILMGLKGLEISERAKQMMAAIEGLENDFGKFSSDIETLGRHINNSKTKYDEVEKKLGRLSDRLGSITGERMPVIEGLEEEKV